MLPLAKECFFLRGLCKGLHISIPYGCRQTLLLLVPLAGRSLRWHPKRSSASVRTSHLLYSLSQNRLPSNADPLGPRCPTAADVDGTLIRSAGPDANKLHKEAFAAAFKEVFGLDTTIDVVPHHGSTDPLILVKVCVFHNIPHNEAMAKLPEMQQAMVDYFLAHRGRAGQGLEVLPGVVNLLETLQGRDDVAVCLVTGNLQPIGWAKMEALGIKHLFTEPYYGGFGSDFCSGRTEESWKDRAELVRIAAERCREYSGEEAGLRFHVGDAPMDVQAAHAAGAHPIGVLTGIYTLAELEAACPTATLLPGLHDLEKVMEVLRL